MNKKLLIVILLFVVVLTILVVVTVVLSGSDSDSTDKGAAQGFRSGGIVPDVLGSVPDSLGVITIHYPGDITLDSVTGVELTPGETSQKPTSLTWSPCDGDFLHSVVMTDPDAPDPAEPTLREYRHWVVMNVRECDVTTGVVRTPYKGPSPPTGVHRYVFLVYKQQGELTDADLQEKGITLNGNPENRQKWKVQEFAKALNLTLVAGNYFKAQTSVSDNK